LGLLLFVWAINLIKDTCDIMPEADPDIFGESHHDNYRAISCPRQTPTSSGNCTATGFP